MSDRTLGILGLGRIGGAVARIGSAFGMKVIAWSQNLTAQHAAEAGATAVSKEELFTRADILTIHTLLSRRTRRLVDEAMIARMKSDAWLIKTSRGPIVDEGALIETLGAQRIGGYAVHVFAEEPLPLAHPFRTLPNVLATPHIGYVAEDLYRTFYGDSARAIAGWLGQT
ncbi:NAD(P)-dependent oxidoreductase [Bradyrhizobium genosp. P]|uniref:NAD(P)-dependent oxidoreductase n=1 Tax=Bradyrhizobium genosp. P TaxID=83641 RepID=UPI003CF60F16